MDDYYGDIDERYEGVRGCKKVGEVEGESGLLCAEVWAVTNDKRGLLLRRMHEFSSSTHLSDVITDVHPMIQIPIKLPWNTTVPFRSSRKPFTSVDGYSVVVRADEAYSDIANQ